MKAIQITFDERLLKELDADPEVKRDGRSLVMRRAVYDYLRRKRRRAIAEGYRDAYDETGWAP
jgi:metal-responsive CopG/Arc/MetJ family transcriptional regulator